MKWVNNICTRIWKSNNVWESSVEDKCCFALFPLVVTPQRRILELWAPAVPEVVPSTVRCLKFQFLKFADEWSTHKAGFQTEPDHNWVSSILEWLKPLELKPQAADIYKSEVSSRKEVRRVILQWGWGTVPYAEHLQMRECSTFASSERYPFLPLSHLLNNESFQGCEGLYWGRIIDIEISTNSLYAMHPWDIKVLSWPSDGKEEQCWQFLRFRNTISKNKRSPNQSGNLVPP